MKYKEPCHSSGCLASPFVVEQTSMPNFIKVGHRSDLLCPKPAVEDRKFPAFAYLLGLRQRLPIQKMKYFLNNVRGSSWRRRKKALFRPWPWSIQRCHLLLMLHPSYKKESTFKLLLNNWWYEVVQALRKWGDCYKPNHSQYKSRWLFGQNRVHNRIKLSIKFLSHTRFYVDIFLYRISETNSPGELFFNASFCVGGSGGGIIQEGSYSEGELFSMSSLHFWHNEIQIISLQTKPLRLKNMIRWCTRRQESPIRLRNFSRMRIH